MELPSPIVTLGTIRPDDSRAVFEQKKLVSGRLGMPGGKSSRHAGGGPRVVVSTAAFHARVRGSVPGFHV